MAAEGEGGLVASAVGVEGAEDARCVEGLQPAGRVAATPAVEAIRVLGGKVGANSRSAETASTALSTISDPEMRAPGGSATTNASGR